MEEATRHSFNVEPMHCIQNNDHFGHTKVSIYKNPLDVVDSNMMGPIAIPMTSDNVKLQLIFI